MELPDSFNTVFAIRYVLCLRQMVRHYSLKHCAKSESLGRCKSHIILLVQLELSDLINNGSAVHMLCFLFFFFKTVC